MCFVYILLQRCVIFPHLNFPKRPEPFMFLTFWVANLLRAAAACHFSTSLQTRFAPQRRAILPHPNIKKWSSTGVFCIHFASAACHFSTSELPKAPRTLYVFNILSCKFASRRSGLPFFHIFANALCATAACHFSTSQLQKVVLFCTFWLENVLRATATCNFSFLIWRHGSAPAAFASLLSLRNPQIIGKTQRFATSLTFRAFVSSFFWLSRTCIFFWLYFSALLFISPYCRKFDF